MGILKNNAFVENSVKPTGYSGTAYGKVIAASADDILSLFGHLPVEVYVELTPAGVLFAVNTRQGVVRKPATNSIQERLAPELKSRIQWLKDTGNLS